MYTINACDEWHVVDITCLQILSVYETYETINIYVGLETWCFLSISFDTSVTNSMVLIRERPVPTERQPLVGVRIELNKHFCYLFIWFSPTIRNYNYLPQFKASFIYV
jgi:hypothetical protein